MDTFVEIRSYTLRPGTRDAFHRAVTERAIPMLRRWGVDVVAFGPSAHDDDSYVLVRAYPSLDDRQRSQDAFYGSEEWRLGPREEILSYIDSHASVVLELDAVTIAGLRRLDLRPR